MDRKDLRHAAGNVESMGNRALEAVANICGVDKNKLRLGVSFTYTFGKTKKKKKK